MISIGTFIEYYDGLIIGSIATIAWVKTMFPQNNPAMALALSLVAFGAVQYTRPISGFIFGEYGDKIGRKAMLVWSLIITGIGMAGIALTPTYAQIGFLAPVLLILFRLIEGFGIGGEFGGADALLFEYVTKSNRRGTYTSAIQASTGPIGVLMSALSLILALKMLGTSAFIMYGWRILVAIGAIIVVIGAVTRYYMLESPLFKQILLERKISRHPSIEVLKVKWKEIILLTFALIGWLATYLLVFYPVGLSYMLAEKIPMMVAYLAIIIGAISAIVFTILGGFFSDLMGRKPVIIVGAVLSAVMAYLYFYIAPMSPIVASILIVLPVGLQLGALGAFIAEQFPTRLRYSGINIPYQFAFLIIGLYQTIFLPAVIVANHGIIKASFDIFLLVLSAVIATLIAVLPLKETAFAEVKE